MKEVQIFKVIDIEYRLGTTCYVFWYL